MRVLFSFEPILGFRYEQIGVVLVMTGTSGAHTLTLSTQRLSVCDCIKLYLETTQNGLPTEKHNDSAATYPHQDTHANVWTCKCIHTGAQDLITNTYNSLPKTLAHTYILIFPSRWSNATVASNPIFCTDSPFSSLSPSLTHFHFLSLPPPLYSLSLPSGRLLIFFFRSQSQYVNSSLVAFTLYLALYFSFCTVQRGCWQ